MRSRLDQQLEELNNKLIEMGALIEHSIERATRALNEQNLKLAKEVIADDNIIDEQEKEIERLCLKLLLNQQPVAKDLRLISVALKMITDMERIGDQAADISQLCVYLAKEKYIKKLEHITQMGEATIRMVTDSINAFVDKNLDLAREVIGYDDVVDGLYLTVKRDLIQMVHQNVENGEQAFDLLQIAKYYERIGDHAVNIAQWVIFSITGEHEGKSEG